MSKVGICGTFDYELHEEHHKFVEFASQFGEVVVFASHGNTVIKNKGRKAYYLQETRVRNIMQIPMVFRCIHLSGDTNKNFKRIVTYGLTHYVFGPDQNSELDKMLREEFSEIGVEVIDWEYERQVFTTKLLKQDGKWDELQENE